MNIIEQCARCCREQFGHRPVPDWWEQMHQGAREHWISGTNAVLAEFARLAQSEEMVEKIAKAICAAEGHDPNELVFTEKSVLRGEGRGYEYRLSEDYRPQAREALAALFHETGVIS
jgi:hypothetical protein